VNTSGRSPNLVLGERVQLPDSAVLGANVVIHDDVVVGERCTIQDGAILGKLPVLGAASSASRVPPGPLVIEDGASIGAGAIVFAGARIGEGAVVGDQTHVRERATIGAGSVIGRGSAVGPDTQIGARVRVQTNVWITGRCLVEDDVFVGPGVVTTNDRKMARGTDIVLRGATLRRGCRVGGGVVLAPGIEVGEDAFIAAGAVVLRDVPARAVLMSVAGRVTGSVRDEDLLS
jgi:acetyltransferase-like isoleucine patch superfamily enzyme